MQTVPQLRQIKRVLSARAKRKIATPAELRKLSTVRRRLEFRRDLFETADAAMGDMTP